MSARERFRKVQEALGVNASGIPNDESKFAFQNAWDAALREYRVTEGKEAHTVNVAPERAVPKIELGWLAGAIREELPGGASLRVPMCIVIHFTAGASAKSSIEFWKSPQSRGASAHLVIDRDGTVYQCRQFNRTAGHAGVSRWRSPQTGNLFKALNGISLGIELANAGRDAGALAWARKQPGFRSVKHRHRNGEPESEWEVYTPEQLQKCLEVCAALRAAFPSIEDITGHDCISPERKDDPGPAFPMLLLREWCGLKGLPEVHWA